MFEDYVESTLSVRREFNYTVARTIIRSFQLWQRLSDYLESISINSSGKRFSSDQVVLLTFYMESKSKKTNFSSFHVNKIQKGLPAHFSNSCLSSLKQRYDSKCGLQSEHVI